MPSRITAQQQHMPTIRSMSGTTTRKGDLISTTTYGRKGQTLPSLIKSPAISPESSPRTTTKKKGSSRSRYHLQPGRSPSQRRDILEGEIVGGTSPSGLLLQQAHSAFNHSKQRPLGQQEYHHEEYYNDRNYCYGNTNKSSTTTTTKNSHHHHSTRPSPPPDAEVLYDVCEGGPKKQFVQMCTQTSFPEDTTTDDYYSSSTATGQCRPKRTDTTTTTPKVVAVAKTSPEEVLVPPPRRKTLIRVPTDRENRQQHNEMTNAPTPPHRSALIRVVSSSTSKEKNVLVPSSRPPHLKNSSEHKRVESRKKVKSTTEQTAALMGKSAGGDAPSTIQPSSVPRKLPGQLMLVSRSMEVSNNNNGPPLPVDTTPMSTGRLSIKGYAYPPTQLVETALPQYETGGQHYHQHYMTTHEGGAAPPPPMNYILSSPRKPRSPPKLHDEEIHRHLPPSTDVGQTYEPMPPPPPPPVVSIQYHQCPPIVPPLPRCPPPYHAVPPPIVLSSPNSSSDRMMMLNSRLQTPPPNFYPQQRSNDGTMWAAPQGHGGSPHDAPLSMNNGRQMSNHYNQSLNYDDQQRQHSSSVVYKRFKKAFSECRTLPVPDHLKTPSMMMSGQQQQHDHAMTMMMMSSSPYQSVPNYNMVVDDPPPCHPPIECGPVTFSDDGCATTAADSQSHLHASHPLMTTTAVQPTNATTPIGNWKSNNNCWGTMMMPSSNGGTPPLPFLLHNPHNNIDDVAAPQSAHLGTRRSAAPIQRSSSQRCYSSSANPSSSVNPSSTAIPPRRRRNSGGGTGVLPPRRHCTGPPTSSSGESRPPPPRENSQQRVVAIADLTPRTRRALAERAGTSLDDVEFAIVESQPTYVQGDGTLKISLRSYVPRIQFVDVPFELSLMEHKRRSTTNAAAAAAVAVEQPNSLFSHGNSRRGRRRDDGTTTAGVSSSTTSSMRKTTNNNNNNKNVTTRIKSVEAVTTAHQHHAQRGECSN